MQYARWGNCAGDSMDTVFWSGLLIGGLFSIPLSITANIWTDAVRDFLDKRRHVRLSNKKWREVRTYFEVRALREGDPTAKTIFDYEQVDNIRAVIGMLLCLSMALPLIYIYVVREPQVKEHLAAYLSIWGFIGIIFCYFSLYAAFLHWRALRIRIRLRRFHSYEDSIREKWGDDALEKFHMASQQSH